MHRRFLPTILMSLIVAAAFTATCVLFDTKAADASIDWLSFAAGIFLVWEALYKTRRYPASAMPVQASRFFRLFAGLSIFSVHFVQFIWGTDSPAFNMRSITVSIDWTALVFGVFLFAEGLSRMVYSKRRTFLDQGLRSARVVLGTVITAIHILQFTRY